MSNKKKVTITLTPEGVIAIRKVLQDRLDGVDTSQQPAPRAVLLAVIAQLDKVLP